MPRPTQQRARTRNVSVPKPPSAEPPPRKTPTGLVALGVVAFALAFGFYVGHVNATENVLEDVQELRREQLELNLRYNRLRGEFDRRTGPEEVLRRAQALGLEEGIGYGPTIVVEVE